MFVSEDALFAVAAQAVASVLAGELSIRGHNKLRILNFEKSIHSGGDYLALRIKRHRGGALKSRHWLDLMAEDVVGGGVAFDKGVVNDTTFYSWWKSKEGRKFQLAFGLFDSCTLAALADVRATAVENGTYTGSLDDLLGPLSSDDESSDDDSDDSSIDYDENGLLDLLGPSSSDENSLDGSDYSFDDYYENDLLVPLSSDDDSLDDESNGSGNQGAEDTDTWYDIGNCDLRSDSSTERMLKQHLAKKVSSIPQIDRAFKRYMMAKSMPVPSWVLNKDY